MVSCGSGLRVSPRLRRASGDNLLWDLRTSPSNSPQRGRARRSSFDDSVGIRPQRSRSGRSFSMDEASLDDTSVRVVRDSAALFAVAGRKGSGNDTSSSGDVSSDDDTDAAYADVPEGSAAAATKAAAVLRHQGERHHHKSR